MASFQIHEDQENRGRDLRQNKNVGGAVLGQQKRSVLGALDNRPERLFKSNKQPLNGGNIKVNDENAYNKQMSIKPPPPVVPVAQFQAFKVYEDTQEERSKRNIIKIDNKRAKEILQNVYKGTEEDVLVTKREVLEKASLEMSMASIVDIPLNSPMSIEKSPKNSLELLPVGNRNKDLFFEMDEYRSDIYEHLLKQEQLHRPKPNYMRKQPDITHNMRTILVDWLVEVAEEYKLQTETLYLAVNYIDRFLSFMSVVRAKLQLVGTAAMFIAAKYEEIYPPDVGEFVYITDDTYSKRQVIRMEVLILKVLDFDLSSPTAYTFITAMSIANKLPEKVTYLAQFLSELALLEAEPTLEILPSILAASAIAVAQHTIDEKPWNKELEKTTGYNLSDLKRGVEFLLGLHRMAATMAQQAIQEKYRSGKYLHVSSIPPNDDDIKFD